jgi:hypothetical protein
VSVAEKIKEIYCRSIDQADHTIATTATVMVRVTFQNNGAEGSDPKPTIQHNQTRREAAAQAIQMAGVSITCSERALNVQSKTTRKHIRRE